MATGPFSLLLFAGPPHTHNKKGKNDEKWWDSCYFHLLFFFFSFVYMWTPPKDDGQESSWPLNDVMAVECQLSPFSVSPTALMADSLSSCDPAQHRHFLSFLSPTGNVYKVEKKKKNAQGYFKVYYTLTNGPAILLYPSTCHPVSLFWCAGRNTKSFRRVSVC
jgi:hypothetical protein